MSFKVVFLLALSWSLVLGYEDKTIAEWLSANGYTTLVADLKKTGLYDTLNTAGPFTVFAPSNAAFASVPSTLSANTGTLAKVLQYHVVSGFAMVPQLHDGDTQTTLSGEDLHFTGNADTLEVEGAHISQADIVLKNGVVHVIDRVLVPSQGLPTSTIGQLLLLNQTVYSTLNLLLTITDLEPVLQNGSYTLFAPTNDAFNKLASQLPDFSSPTAVAQYTAILKNHLVSGVYTSADLKDGQRLTTLDNKTLVVHMNPSPKIDNSNIVNVDAMATNGVIHTIDTVLLPS